MIKYILASIFSLLLSTNLSSFANESLDWTTYKGNSTRNGITLQTIDLPLHLNWLRQEQLPPNPAWTRPAKQDFWHRKNNLKPKVTFDYAMQPVCWQDYLIIPSSSEDSITCINILTGKTLWRFFSEAPIRLTPTIVKKMVVFSSDDGFVYNLDIKTGKLNWQNYPPKERDQKIPGNGRLISSKPSRSGILIQGETAYVVNGIFPSQGVQFSSLNINTGKVIDHRPLKVSAQGYLASRNKKLFIPNGRIDQGKFLYILEHRGKITAQQTRSIYNEYPHSHISTPQHAIVGGDDKVAIFDLNNGKKIWETEVKGKAYGLALSHHRLILTTDRGYCYCFTKQNKHHKTITPKADSYRYISIQEKNRYETKCQKILDKLPQKRGFCLVLNCHDCKLIYQLVKQSEMQIVVLSNNKKEISKMRNELQKCGVYGKAVIHYTADLKQLPYTKSLFNLIVINKGNDHNSTEIKRVLHPYRGRICLANNPEKIITANSAKPSGKWTQLYANPGNTACSYDKTLTTNIKLQWFGNPGPREMVDRHLRTMPSLSKDGYLFIPARDKVIAMDSFNGTILWETITPTSSRIGILHDHGFMSLGDKYLWVACKTKCLAIEQNSGKIAHTLSLPTAKQNWGYLCNYKDFIIGSSGKADASRRSITRPAIMEGAYGDNTAVVCSESIFAKKIDNKTHWQYHSPTGAIINQTITIIDDKIIFIQSNERQTITKGVGRYNLKQLIMAKGAKIVAINLINGKLLWQQSLQVKNTPQALYLQAKDNNFYLTYSYYNSKKILHYHLSSHSTTDAQYHWGIEQNNLHKSNKDHGEQDLHPVLLADKIFMEPYFYDLKTGDEKNQYSFKKKRSGCGTVSANANQLFFRHKHPSNFNITTNKTANLTKSNRPGCWINIIPVNGLILIPESSSGCTCSFAIQTSLALINCEK